MARNQPNDFSDSSEAHGSLGASGLTSADMELTDTVESMLGDSSIESSRQSSSQSSAPSPAQEAARAAQKTASTSASEARSGSERHDSPTSMAKKRRNQPG